MSSFWEWTSDDEWKARVGDYKMLRYWVNDKPVYSVYITHSWAGDTFRSLYQATEHARAKTKEEEAAA